MAYGLAYAPELAITGKFTGGKNSFIRERKDCQFEEFRPSLSKPIIDQIDRALAQHYGFTDEELDFIINYDIKYRMGRDAGGEEE